MPYHAPRTLVVACLGALSAGAGALGALPSPTVAGAAAPVHFAAPVVVDQQLAGGEPFVIQSRTGTLVYTSHEGTTHLYRAGLAGSPSEDGAWVSNYRNQVNIWTSADHGATWQRVDWMGTGFTVNPSIDTGFSDPDLTQDAGGTIYDTGIDLANDAVFSSPDGGRTWPNGTTQCHEGDRPWLAGGKAGEVFMTTDTDTGQAHALFHSTDSGASCSSQAIPDNGRLADGGTWTGFGKLMYDPFDGSIIEPAQFVHKDGSFGVGISRLADAAAAFNGGGETFQPQEIVRNTSVYSPFGAPNFISMDSAQNIYFAWDTDDRAGSKTTGGCDAASPVTGTTGGPTPLPNHIMFVAGRYQSPGHWHFTAPVSVSHQGDARVLWPWSVAGRDGDVSVVWYQMDRMVDPDCDLYNGQAVPDVKTYVEEAHITGATDPATRRVSVTQVTADPVHVGGICDSGTACVATGQDRRLGDLFSNALDDRGCVMIATGDTNAVDPVTGLGYPVSRPLFIHQDAGPSLTTGLDCGSAAGAVAGSTTASGPGGGPGSGGAGGTPPATGSSPVGLANTGPAVGPVAPLAALAVLPAAAVLRRRRSRR